MLSKTKMLVLIALLSLAAFSVSAETIDANYVNIINITGNYWVYGWSEGYDTTTNYCIQQDVKGNVYVIVKSVDIDIDADAQSFELCGGTQLSAIRIQKRPSGDYAGVEAVYLRFITALYDCTEGRPVGAMRTTFIIYYDQSIPCGYTIDVTEDFILGIPLETTIYRKRFSTYAFDNIEFPSGLYFEGACMVGSVDSREALRSLGTVVIAETWPEFALVKVGERGDIAQIYLRSDNCRVYYRLDQGQNMLLGWGKVRYGVTQNILDPFNPCDMMDTGEIIDLFFDNGYGIWD